MRKGKAWTAGWRCGGSICRRRLRILTCYQVLIIYHGLIMGWMRTLLLGDIGNRLDIADTEREISAVRAAHAKSVSNLQRSKGQIEAMRDEIGRQKLAIQALARFLVNREIISATELADFIREVDAEDGVVDGKMSIDPVNRRLVFPENNLKDGTFRKIES